MRSKVLILATAAATAGLGLLGASASASTATGPGHCSVGSFTGPIAAGGMNGIVHYLQSTPGGVAGFTTGGYLDDGVC